MAKTLKVGIFKTNLENKFEHETQAFKTYQNLGLRRQKCRRGHCSLSGNDPFLDTDREIAWKSSVTRSEKSMSNSLDVVSLLSFFSLLFPPFSVIQWRKKKSQKKFIKKKLIIFLISFEDTNGLTIN